MNVGVGEGYVGNNETKRKVGYVQMASLGGYPKGLGCTVPLRDGDDARGGKAGCVTYLLTFSAFVTPSGMNLHNTVADSNHLLASLNWVALRNDREKKV